MTLFHAGLLEVVQRDRRYAYEAYEFLFHALHHTQKMLGREPPPPPVIEGQEQPAQEQDPRFHVTGQELAHGIRELALQEFGLMARTVFSQWGIQRTDDFGEMVFNLVEAGLMSKTDQDTREDFRAVYDLDQALVQGYSIPLDEANDS
jgi:uncharacterized repeat protein (TIGR04138 family)